MDIIEQTSLDYDLYLLKQAVLIPSASKNLEGVMKVQWLFAEELTKMGFSIKWIPSSVGTNHYLLHATKSGENLRAISFVGHADTVLAPNSQFEFKVTKDRIYGSGVADDKGGVCVALKALREFLSCHPKHLYTLHFISSPNEEVGSIGFHHYFQEIGRASDYVFGLEPSLPDGSLINERNGNTWYKISVKGKSAHAGRFGEVAINAAHELSRIICSLYQLNNLSEKTKVNVGTITGGSGHFNVVCGDAEALIDIRFPNLDIRQKIHNEIEKLIANPEVCCLETGAKPIVSYTIMDDCPPLALTSKGECLGDLLASIHCKNEGQYIGCKHTGGAADANYFSCNNSIIDGVGPIGGGLHTVHEYIELSSFYTRALGLKEVLLKINSN